MAEGGQGAGHQGRLISDGEWRMANGGQRVKKVDRQHVENAEEK